MFWILRIWFNTSLAAPGAPAHCLQCRTACKIQNGCQGDPKWPTGNSRESMRKVDDGREKNMGEKEKNDNDGNSAHYIINSWPPEWHDNQLSRQPLLPIVTRIPIIFLEYNCCLNYSLCHSVFARTLIYADIYSQHIFKSCQTFKHKKRKEKDHFIFYIQIHYEKDIWN